MTHYCMCSLIYLLINERIMTCNTYTMFASATVQCILVCILLNQIIIPRNVALNFEKKFHSISQTERNSALYIPK